MFRFMFRAATLGALGMAAYRGYQYWQAKQQEAALPEGRATAQRTPVESWEGGSAADTAGLDAARRSLREQDGVTPAPLDAAVSRAGSAQGGEPDAENPYPSGKPFPLHTGPAPGG
jgi:hypothetical protein